MKITESQLRDIISESIKKCLSENDFINGKLNPFQSPEVQQAIKNRKTKSPQEIKKQLEKNPETNNVKPSERVLYNPRRQNINKKNINENKIMDFFRNIFAKAPSTNDNQIAGIAYEIFKEMQGRTYYGNEVYDHLNELLNDYMIANPNDKKRISNAVCLALQRTNQLN